MKKTFTYVTLPSQHIQMYVQVPEGQEREYKERARLYGGTFHTFEYSDEGLPEPKKFSLTGSSARKNRNGYDLARTTINDGPFGSIAEALTYAEDKYLKGVPPASLCDFMRNLSINTYVTDGVLAGEKRSINLLVRAVWDGGS
jgi:hypothetical protein